MICPEGVEQCCNESKEDVTEKSVAKAGGSEMNSCKPKSWKKSITNFFRSQLRSTKSNDGDGPSNSQEKYDEKEISRDQKWQSLGKIFKRQSFVEHWNNSPKAQGENSTQSKTLVRKVISSYFGKNQKSVDDIEN